MCALLVQRRIAARVVGKRDLTRWMVAAVELPAPVHMLAVSELSQRLTATQCTVARVELAGHPTLSTGNNG